MAAKQFSMEEVAQHNKAGDLWIVVDGGVYDVSKFARMHPGGERVLRSVAGRDASEAFWSLHRSDVLRKYARLLVGRIAGSPAPAAVDPGAPSLVPYASPCEYQGYASPYITDAHRAFARRARAWYAENVIPEADMLERQGKVPGADLRRKLAVPGLIATLAAGHGDDRWLFRLKELGLEGTVLGVEAKDFDAFHGQILGQELARVGSQGFTDGLVGASAIGLPPLAMFGPKHLRDRVIPEVIRGEKTIALAVSEPYAGSDVANITCEAKKSECGRYYIVNGEKKWITGGTTADYFSVAVRTGGRGWGGVSMLMIPRCDGVVTTPIPTAYSACAGTAYVMFTDVKVPVENIIGKVNLGVITIASNFNFERHGMCVAINERCRVIIDECFRWAMNRKVFGKRLLEQPVIRMKLAEMCAAVESMQHWIDNVTYQFGAMKPAQQMKLLGGMTALLKYHSTRVSIKVGDHAAQIMGGRGLTRTGMGVKVQRFMQDIKFSALLGGAEEVMADFAMRDAQKKMPQGARL